MSMDRRAFIISALGATGAALAPAQSPKPNIIFIFADDLGYGDLGIYGSGIQTPNIDQMAKEGVRFRQFYAASPVCSPSRAALLTGRYPTRTGIPRVMFSDDNYGLPSTETTMAQVLKSAGYKTMCIGKWHLGSLPEFLPTNRGFDEFYGVPYSNDMQPLPLIRNLAVVEPDTDISTLTPRYTQQAVDFIARSKDAPFFLYMPHTYPHIPLAASPRFKGKSGLGLYGDAVEEIDWSVGEVLKALKANDLDNNTLVMFSSDNGPWFQGSAGRLRGRKGDTYEGGVREPFIARFPGRIPVDTVSSGIASTMDILPTIARLAGASLPKQPLDGINIWPLLMGESNDLSREVLLYFDNWNIQCARMGRWKLHVARYNGIAWTPDPPGGRLNLPLYKPELYDLENDPDESYDTAADNPQVVADIRARIEAILPTFPDQVRTAWRDTLSNAVDLTPSGALPAKKVP